MPATVIVGGQFGSEGKGKVAEFWARKHRADAVVRVGGSNSGHTTLTSQDGQRRVLRQLPTAALMPDVLCVLAPGAYIDPDVLLREIAEVGLSPERLVVDPLAMTIGVPPAALWESVHPILDLNRACARSLCYLPGMHVQRT